MMGRHQYINEDEYEVNLKDFEPQPGKRLSGEAAVCIVGRGTDCPAMGSRQPWSLMYLQWCSAGAEAVEIVLIGFNKWLVVSALTEHHLCWDLRVSCFPKGLGS